MYTQDQLRSMDVKALEDLYGQQLELLNSRLLSGVAWTELSFIRGYLTQIGVAIDVNMAEAGIRKNTSG